MYFFFRVGFVVGKTFFFFLTEYAILIIAGKIILQTGRKLALS